MWNSIHISSSSQGMSIYIPPYRDVGDKTKVKMNTGKTEIDPRFRIATVNSGDRPHPDESLRACRQGTKRRTTLLGTRFLASLPCLKPVADVSCFKYRPDPKFFWTCNSIAPMWLPAYRSRTVGGAEVEARERRAQQHLHHVPGGDEAGALPALRCQDIRKPRCTSI